MDHSRPTENRCLDNALTESPASVSCATSSTSSTNTYGDKEQNVQHNLSDHNIGSEVSDKVDDRLSANGDLHFPVIRSFRTPQIERRAFRIDCVERSSRDQRSMSVPCVIYCHGMPMMSDPCVTSGHGVLMSDPCFNNDHGMLMISDPRVINGHRMNTSDSCIINDHGMHTVSDPSINYLPSPKMPVHKISDEASQLTSYINSDIDGFSKEGDFEIGRGIIVNRDDPFYLKQLSVKGSPSSDKRQLTDADFSNVDAEVILLPSMQNVSGCKYSPSWQDVASMSDRAFTPVFCRDASLSSNCVIYEDFMTKTSSFSDSIGNDIKLSSRDVAPSIAAKMKRMQSTTDIFSLLFYCTGLLLLTLTPFMLIPIFVFPTGNTSLFIALMFVSGGLSILFMAIGSTIGNIYWYYDDELGKIRCKLHCGKGPKLHFWGKSLGWYKPLKNVYVI